MTQLCKFLKNKIFWAALDNPYLLKVGIESPDDKLITVSPC